MVYVLLGLQKYNKNPFAVLNGGFPVQITEATCKRIRRVADK